MEHPAALPKSREKPEAAAALTKSGLIAPGQNERVRISAKRPFISACRVLLVAGLRKGIRTETKDGRRARMVFPKTRANGPTDLGFHLLPACRGKERAGERDWKPLSP